MYAKETESLEVSTTDDSIGSSGITLNEYNGYSQLVRTTSDGTTALYTYNGDGLRTSKTVNGTVTNHIWDGDQIALETDSAGNVTNKYVRGINLLYAENTAGARQYYLFNGHGDVVQLTGTDGSVTKNYDYDAFGNEKNPDANDTNVFRYCGEYFDKETGTIYLRARYYDPQVGRFITEDSYWGKDSDQLSLNLYTYCESDPIDNIDPSGHDTLSDYYYSTGQTKKLIQYENKKSISQRKSNSGTTNKKHATNNKKNPIVKALTGPMPNITVQYGVSTRASAFGFTASFQLEQTKDNIGRQALTATLTWGMSGTKEKRNYLPSISKPSPNFGIFLGKVGDWVGAGKNTGFTSAIGVDYAESGKYKGIQISGGGTPEIHTESSYTWVWIEEHNTKDDGMFDGPGS